MKLQKSILSIFGIVKNPFSVQLLTKTYYSTAENESKEKNPTGGFARAFEKQTKAAFEKEITVEETFAKLFRKSKFIDMGDPEGKKVTGTIFHVIRDDLYIDFGWKFYCVCLRPQKNGSDYVRGSKVLLLLKDLELSTRFLGSDKDLTVLEADAVLLGLLSSPIKSTDATADNNEIAS